MVITTSKDITWQPTPDVQPGTYFTLTGTWHLCLKPAVPADLLKPYHYSMRVALPTGRITTASIYTHRLEVAAQGTRPAPFDPASMRANAAYEERQAQELLESAGARRRLAHKIESGAEIS